MLEPSGATPGAALQVLRAAAASGGLDDLCARHRVRILTVFGSAARLDPDARDLDVGVRFEPGQAGDVLALLDELSRLTRCEVVDLLVLDDAGPVARERALVGCIALFESVPGAYATAQMAATCERMDTAWLRDLDFALLRA